ncbi:hypothetical protein RJ641_010376, partial [Dillenia turbinata]
RKRFASYVNLDESCQADKAKGSQGPEKSKWVWKPSEGNGGQGRKVVGKSEQLVNEAHVKSLPLYMPKALSQPL